MLKLSAIAGKNWVEAKTKNNAMGIRKNFNYLLNFLVLVGAALAFITSTSIFINC